MGGTRTRGALAVLPLLAALVASGCGGGGDEGRFAFTVVLDGLPSLGALSGLYEGWAVVGGEPRSTGRFRIDDSVTPPAVLSPNRQRSYGTVDGATFGPANTFLGQAFPFIAQASDFFITIEPEGDRDGQPSGNVILFGSFSGDTAPLTASRLATGGLAGAQGAVTVVTATEAGAPADRGAWFVDPGAAPGPLPTLQLPPLLGDWTYEAFLSDGTDTWSLGKFLDPSVPDFDAATAATRGADGIGFATPGQDFLVAALEGATRRLELTDGGFRVEVTVEPSPDNSRGPFPVTVLAADVPPDAVGPTGLAQRNVPLQQGRLPFLDVAVAGGSLSFDGFGPRSLGGPEAGHFACWAVVGGTPGLAGRFRVDASGAVVSLDGLTVFGVPDAFVLDAAGTGLGPAFPDVQAATELFVTVEPQGSPLPGPSEQVLLAGVSNGSSAELTLRGLTSLGGRGLADFSGAAGSFSCQSPTNDGPGVAEDDQRGVWFVLVQFTAVPSLSLPELPAGWTYEGFVVVETTGERLSTGKFRDTDGPDFDAGVWPGRGTLSAGFSAPGQDFVTVAPGRVVPTMTTTGLQVLVTVEPFPDTSREPFFLRVLEGTTGTTPGVPVPLAPAPGGLPSGMAVR